MGIAYINQTIEIPRVTSQEITREILGQRKRTAGGKMRMDINGFVPIKRQWKLKSAVLTNAQYDTIISYLDSVLWCEVDFWLDEFGGTPSLNSIKVFIEVSSDSRRPFQGDSGWDSRGRDLDLTIIEQ
jgi:hypothetical protein